jgi:hypothetical protein
MQQLRKWTVFWWWVDNRNCSHLILQYSQSNLFQVVIWPSLHISQNPDQWTRATSNIFVIYIVTQDKAIWMLPISAAQKWSTKNNYTPLDAWMAKNKLGGRLHATDTSMPERSLTCMRCLGRARTCPSICLFRYDFPSFQADIVCVSSSSSVKSDPLFPSCK